MFSLRAAPWRSRTIHSVPRHEWQHGVHVQRRDRRLAHRWGDVMVVCRDDWAVMTRRQPKEFGLVGMHGSLTEFEMRVPVLVG